MPITAGTSHALQAVAASSAPAVGAGRRVRRILLATDLSTGLEEAATAEAIQLAGDLHADLLVVSVIEDASRALVSLTERMDQRRAAREAAAQALVLRGAQAGVRVSFLVWEGEPGPAIVEAAASEQVDMIVVGVRGRNRIERLVLGSVSDHVVRHAHCPVLIARS